jgi:sugar phosphate isomerase/epimerase
VAIACSTSIFSRSTLEEALRGIRDMGFRQIDLLVIDGWVHVHTTDLANNYKGTVTRVDQLLQQYGLTPIVLNAGISPLLHDRSPQANARREAETRALIRFMDHLQVSVATIQPRTPDPDRPRDEVLSDSAATMNDMIEMARGAGVTLALECHAGSIVESVDAVQEMLRLVPELTLAYDPTHFVMNGVALEETLPLLARTSQVHLRDAAPGKMQARLGEGVVDFDWILERLEERGYQGHYSIEYLEVEGVDLSGDVRRLYNRVAEHIDRWQGTHAP